MEDGRRELGWAHAALVALLAALTLGVGLGRGGRLSYHEAFVAQAAREINATGDWLVPRVGGQPWLEKPPLAFWLVALVGKAAGGINETIARMPSALAGGMLALGVAYFAARRFGPGVGLLAGLVQATTAWTVMRGRLAEVDMVLACLITWCVVLFDRLRADGAWIREGGTTAIGVDPTHAPNPLPERKTYNSPPWEGGVGGVGIARPLWANQPAASLLHLTSAGQRDQVNTSAHSPPPLPPLPKGGSYQVPRDTTPGCLTVRIAFFVLLGLSSLAKGIGFGGALVGASLLLVLAWDRDCATCRRLVWWLGIGLAALLTLAWPALVIQRYPQAFSLWTLHVTDRLAAHPEHFAGEAPWWTYLPALFLQTLPWTPLAVGGAIRSLGRACGRAGRFGADRLLWAWAVAPVVLLSLATVKNAHYVIHALPPWSVWAALGLVRLGERLQRRGIAPARLRHGVLASFAVLGLMWALGFTLLGPRIRGRGVEWVFYARAAKALSSDEPVVLLYNVPDWDRYPYPTPFGPVPHDLAVRLFYLNRPALCRYGADDLKAHPPAPSFAVIGRESDLAGLKHIGRVDTLAVGPKVRWDRAYRLYRVTRGGGKENRVSAN